MKRENDELTDLFRSRLSDAEITVRDGFWKDLNQDIILGQQKKRRLLFVRVAAAASILLVLAASSITFWYLSPQEEIGEAFNKIAVTNGGIMDGDGVRANPLPIPVEPILHKPIHQWRGNTLSQVTEDDDSISITLSMSFSFSATATGGMFDQKKNIQRTGGLWQDEEELLAETTQGEQNTTTIPPAKKEKKRTWAIKAVAGTGLAAENTSYKMPVSAGITIEKSLNKYIGLETGVMYTNLRSEGQRLHYLGIPVKMNVTLAETRRLNFYASVGGVVDKCIAGAPDNSFKSEPVQLAITAGVGINYKINERIALFAEPGISHHFKTDSETPTVRTERPTNFNLLCGIRMTY